MKSKKLLAVFTAMLCLTGAVSCEKNDNDESDNKSAASEVKEAVPDEKVTEEGKIPAYQATEIMYDANDEIIREAVNVYNKFDDVLSVEINGDSENYTYEYSADGIALKCTSVSSENTVGYVDKVLYTYDVHGEVASFKIFMGDALFSEARYENEYDNEDRLSFSRCYSSLGEGEEQFAESTVYTYDEKGLLSETQKSYPDSEDAVTTVFTYDENGNTLSEVTTTENTYGEIILVSEINYTYNSHNLPKTQECLQDGKFQSKTKYEYEFYD